MDKFKGKKTIEKLGGGDMRNEELLPRDSSFGRRAVSRGAQKVPRIVISGLEKSYGQKKAINGVDLVVEPGQFLVLLGPSGSGKSTLLRCLAGIERPTRGTISFDDLVVDGAGIHLPPEKRNLAVVFQDYALWPHLSAVKNVAFALQRTGISSEARRLRSNEMLERVGLGGLSDRYPSQLSGGEQQRVGLARALVANPGILLFDEPLSNLDADRREKLRVDIGSMVRSEGATAVYITHDQAEAFALADVIGVLNAGELVQVGTPEEVYRSPNSAFVARFTGLAGELSGTVLGDGPHSRPGTVAVEVGGSVVCGRQISGETLKVGQKAQVLVRTSALKFVDSENMSVDDSHFEASRIEGGVLDAAFRGWGYEHVVAVADGSHLSGVPATARLPFMSRVLLELDVDGCLVIAAESDKAIPHGPKEMLEAGEYEEWESFRVLTMDSEPW